MPYPAKSIANSFLNRATRDGIPIDPMKLQKLIYYAHGYHLGAYEEPLIDEYFEAWPYGPVVPGIYHEFSEFGRNPITRLATDLDWTTEEEVAVPPPMDDPRVERVIDTVWSKYKGVDGLALSEMTHRAGTPWSQVQEENKYRIKNKDIDNKKIEQFFRNLVKKKK